MSKKNSSDKLTEDKIQKYAKIHFEKIKLPKIHNSKEEYENTLDILQKYYEDECSYSQDVIFSQHMYKNCLPGLDCFMHHSSGFLSSNSNYGTYSVTPCGFLIDSNSESDNTFIILCSCEIRHGVIDGWFSIQQGCYNDTIFSGEGTIVNGNLNGYCNIEIYHDDTKSFIEYNGIFTDGFFVEGTVTHIKYNDDNNEKNTLEKRDGIPNEFKFCLPPLRFDLEFAEETSPFKILK
jgi:hypothetical protein